MSPESARHVEQELLSLYDYALPHVYGYLLARCGERPLAEDLTSETFLAAADAVRGTTGRPRELGRSWLIGVARHKLADHWRREARDRSHLQSVADDSDHPEDPWEIELDRVLAQQTLAVLAPQHRIALMLRYIDDLTVRQCAQALDRTELATEALLVRARSAFRNNYPPENHPRKEGLS